MADVKIADYGPRILELEPGSYWWCACGRSADQPFCDGSHAGTGITPVEFEVAEPRNAAMCMCKHTDTAPFCDGSHAKL